MHLSFCQYLLLLLLRRRSHHYLSAHNKARNPPVKEKKKNSNFNRHTSERTYCGRKNAYRKKEKEVESKKCKKKIIQCSRSSSEDDSDVAICFDESDISFSENFDANDYNTKVLQNSDFVLCKFFTEKWRIAICWYNH